MKQKIVYGAHFYQQGQHVNIFAILIMHLTEGKQESRDKKYCSLCFDALTQRIWEHMYVCVSVCGGEGGEKDGMHLLKVLSILLGAFHP